jgi:hypothetical protein
MKCVVLSLCLSEAVVSAPTALDFTPALNIYGDDVMSIAIIRNAPSAPLQREIVALPCEQDEVHAVVVEMPEVISCWHTPRPRPPVQPYEQPPATPVFQLATNEVKSSVSN